MPKSQVFDKPKLYSEDIEEICPFLRLNKTK